MYIVFKEKDIWGNGRREYIGTASTIRGAKAIRTRYWNKHGFANIEVADMQNLVISEHNPLDVSVPLVDVTKGVYSGWMIRKSKVPTAA